MENKKQLFNNMLFNLIAFVINLGISFFLSRYIINTIGAEANGFVTLANNVVNYANILIIALNSMASRYVTISICQNDYKTANEYFNSVLFSNIIVSLLLIIPSILIVVFLEFIFNINPTILTDVKYLFLIIFINFFATLINTAFSIATFSSNRLDLSAKKNAISHIIRAILLILLFYIFSPNVLFVGLASLASTIYLLFANIKLTKDLTPYLKVNKKSINIKKIIEIVKSGVWNIVTKLGQILTDGLDLLISNIFISDYAMGLLAISKTINTAILTMISTVSSIFQPKNTKHFADKDKDKLIENVVSSMKITGFFSNIPLVFLLIFGFTFYSLWVPGQDIYTINILSILGIASLLIGGVIDPLWNIFTITNKLKLNSIVILLTGVLNTIIVFLMVRYTSIGIFAIAGVSSLTAIIKNLTFTPIYTAKCIGVSPKPIYKVILKYIIVTFISSGIMYLLSKIIKPTTWIILILCGLICALLTAVLNYYILFSEQERDFFNTIPKKVISKLRKKKIKKNNNIYFCITYYHLLVTIVKVIRQKDKEDLLLSKSLKNCEEIKKRLEDEHIFNNIIIIDDKKYNYDNNIRSIKIFTNKKVLKKEILKIVNFKEYNNIYIYNDWTSIGEYLQNNNIKYHLLEDGLDCFKQIDYFIDDINCLKINSKLRNWLNIGCNPYGKSDCVLDIEVNDKNGIKINTKKIIENNKDKLFNNLTKNDINIILDIFNINNINNIPKNSVIIITQPLFEDCLVNSEKDQINIYKKIIKDYISDYKIVIKPHPRDKIDYENNFKDCIILNRDFPLELINYIRNISFAKGITISSTAIKNINIIKEKIILGFEYINKETNY